MDGLNFGGKCKSFRCGKGKQAVPQERLRLTSQGCGGFGGGMMMMGGAMGKPDSPLVTCCDRKHACYQTCGAKKEDCDDTFKACNEETCAASDSKEECDKDANLYGIMASLGGCKGWDEAQRMACSCVKSDDAPKRRYKTLKKFYQKHNKANVPKAAKFAKKANSALKFAKVITSLVKKYPAAVKRVKDPKAAHWEEMMKQARDAPPAEKKKPAVEMDGEDDDSADEDVVDLDDEKIEL